MQWHPKAADLPALLAKLCDAGVEFIIVGGVAAVLQGVPITTIDLDIVHRRTPENVARLLEVLHNLDATMRYDLARRGLRPTAEMLAGKGQINLSTSLGVILHHPDRHDNLFARVKGPETMPRWWKQKVEL